MLTISVEAGLGFDQALAKLVRNRPGRCPQEFGRMLQETQAGAARKDALHHLAERTDVEELRSFVTALVQADVVRCQHGSRLARTGERDAAATASARRSSALRRRP